MYRLKKAKRLIYNQICIICISSLRFLSEGANMKTQRLLTVLLFVSFTPSLSQTGNPFLNDDTVTTGNFDDCHPALNRSMFMFGMTVNQWLVFERRSDSISMIAAKKCLQPSASWDTSVAIISSSPIEEDEQLADISASYYPSVGHANMYTVVAWQQRKNLVWNIYCSAQRGDSLAWDPAVPLTNDSISCTNARVVAYNDSVFILTWKRGNAVLFEFITHSPSSSPMRFSTSDTLAVSNDDSLNYDISLYGMNGFVVWTARDSSGCRILLLRQINTYPIFALAPPETLSIRGNISNPQFIEGLGFSSSLLYELAVNNRHEIHFWNGFSDTNISQDSLSDCRNARALISPKVIGKTDQALNKESSIAFDVFTMEKNRYGDSLLFFRGDFAASDSIKSIGYNRNACISSTMYYLPQGSGYAVPFVWESNRDGRSHLYSRLVAVDIGQGVKDIGNRISSFELAQNFPNPFNPTTVINYQLLANTLVTLKIYDVLGRLVKTLVEERQTAGPHSVTFNASTLSSGVYLYRLTAGSFVNTKKLILIK